MLKGIKMVNISNDDSTKVWGDLNINFSGDDINNGCYVSELRTYTYEKEFQLTSKELSTIEKLDKELVASKGYDVTLDLVKGTISKS